MEVLRSRFWDLHIVWTVGLTIFYIIESYGRTVTDSAFAFPHKNEDFLPSATHTNLKVRLAVEEKVMTRLGYRPRLININSQSVIQVIYKAVFPLGF